MTADQHRSSEPSMVASQSKDVHKKSKGFSIGNKVILLGALVAVINIFLNYPSASGQLKETEWPTPEIPTDKVEHPRIAIITGHIPSGQSKDSERISPTYLDFLINKACYAKIWGYDFIFNTTPGFSKQEIELAPWLEFGTWHRVPHVASQISNYDWILYADTDWVVQDMSRPLESFLKEFELYGKDPSFFIPSDSHLHSFSAYTFMVRNSPFGRTVLNNWLQFGRRLCRNGNIKGEYDKEGKLKYTWLHSDQPGIWYSLYRTHMHFFNPQMEESSPSCNQTTGYIISERGFGPELNKYMRKVGAKKGSDGELLSKVPNDQPIIWSTPERGRPYSGLGFQMGYAVHSNDTRQHSAFALHKKKDMPPEINLEIEMCKKKHGCYANYTEDGELRIGCDGDVI